MNLLLTLAQAASTQPVVEPPGWAKLLSNSFFPILLGLMIIMIFMSRNKNRGEEKTRQARLADLKKGDRVQTIGGVIATVVTADDKEVVLKVDETTNTKMRFSRTAVHRVLEGEK